MNLDRLEVVRRWLVLVVLLVIAGELWAGYRELWRLHADMPTAADVSEVASEVGGLEKTLGEISSSVENIENAMP